MLDYQAVYKVVYKVIKIGPIFTYGEENVGDCAHNICAKNVQHEFEFSNIIYKNINLK